MRRVLASIALSALALTACKAPLPGRSAEEQAAQWPNAEWRDDLGNIWDAKVEGRKLTAKGTGGAAQGLTLSGEFTPTALPYEITLPDGTVIANGEAKFVDGEHATFITRLIDGTTNAHGLMHFGHPPTVATLLEAGGGQIPQVSGLSGAWMDDAGNVWAVSIDKDSRLVGVGASGAVIGARFEGTIAGGAMTYIAYNPDGGQVSGSGGWDGGCHISWRTLAETPLLEGEGLLHVNHAPGQNCDGTWPGEIGPGETPAEEGETPLDGAVNADLSTKRDPVSGETPPLESERGPVDLAPK
jgi:hypothetical protein